MIGRACTAAGCLTHPILCEGARCPDYTKGKIYKEVTHTLPYVKEGANGECEADVFSRRAPKAEEEKGCRKYDLGRVLSQDSGNRRRISKNCLPGACNTGKTGLVMQ
jgi:hypothetical protein